MADIEQHAVDWWIAPGEIPYPVAVAAMEARVERIVAGTAPEAVWLLEHPPLYTAGTGARDEELLDAARFPVFRTGRGGRFTYHGPGQRIAYLMLDLKRRGEDVRCFVRDVEDLVIGALATFNVRGERREGRIGVWIARPERGSEEKIAAIGVRVRRWVTFHGVSINVEPDLSHYAGIVPCGIRGFGVTSLVDLGLPVAMADLDVALKASFEAVFGAVAVREEAPPELVAEEVG
jgi:lipoyl(octanoyl) transferase